MAGPTEMRSTGRRGLLRSIALTSAVGLALTGCSWLGSDDPPAQPEPLGFPTSWIWSAAPGVSLDSADVRTVRGWVESQTLYSNARVSYPGFGDATSADLLNELSPSASGTQDGGTERDLIRSVNVVGGELRASLCSDGWDVFSFTADGSFLDAQTALATRTLVMRKSGPTNATSSPLGQSMMAAVRDEPSPTPVGRVPYGTWLKGPSENVFNGWMAVSWEVSVEPPADCVAWFKRNHPGLDYPTGYTAEARPNRPTAPPPPTVSASPGW